VTEDDVRNQQLSTEAILAIIDSQLQILSSTSVLETGDRGSWSRPGSLSSTGLMSAWWLERRHLASSRKSSPVRIRRSNAEQIALEQSPRDALYVSAAMPRTFVIIVGVDTRDPEKSALIANKIVDTYLDSEGAGAVRPARAHLRSDRHADQLRCAADLDEAEREVERFKAENGIVGVGGQYIDDKEILAHQRSAGQRPCGQGRCSRQGPEPRPGRRSDEVLSGCLSQRSSLSSTTSVDLRKQYTQTKSNAECSGDASWPAPSAVYVSARQSLETITCGNHRANCAVSWPVRRPNCSGPSRPSRSSQARWRWPRAVPWISRSNSSHCANWSARPRPRGSIYEAFFTAFPRDQRTLQPVDPQCPGDLTGRGATATRWARRASSSPLAE
jgi:succinoglycan biosynthesis transport protein ExoP